MSQSTTRLMSYFRRIWRRLRGRRPSLNELSSLDAYALWADHYPAEAHNQLMQIEETAMRDLLPDLQLRQVLDAACGSGRYTHLALAHGAERVIGLDNSPAMLRQAQIPYRVCASLTALPLASGSLDVILCGLAVGHLPELAPVFSEFARVLVPGGYLLLSDLHPFQALNGAQRTFTVNGVTRAVEHHLHLYSDYHRAADSAGLTLDALREPALSHSQNAPVVLLLRFRKRA